MKAIHLVFIFIILISCSTKREEEEKTVFRYNEAAGVTSLDPAYAMNLANIWICNQLYNGLLQLDSQLIVKPCIAKSWSVSDDGMLYTFLLRDDVYFHDHQLFPGGQGRKVVASDFVYSFNRIMDKKNASPGAWVFNIVDSVDNKAGFRAVNDSVFEIHLKHPFTPFSGILCTQYCAVVPEEIVEHPDNEFRKNPAGTGPFRFQIWKEGVKLVLLKNDHYFEYSGKEQLPYLDAVAITFLKDKQSAFLEFVKGNLDFMSGIDPNYKDELLTKRGELQHKYHDRFYMITEPYLNTEYLGILIDTSLAVAKESPLRMIAIRKAINFGFDRKKMIKYLRNGIGTPGNYGIIPPGMPSFDTAEMKGYDYNPGLSQKLMKQAGFENGKDLPLIILSTTSEYLDLCKYIQHQLNEIGIEIDINVNTPGSIKELKAQSKLQFFRASWVADYPDAENYLSLFYSKNFSPGGPNYTHFSNNTFDDMFEMSQLIVNDSLRFKFYTDMNTLIMKESPVVILYYDQVLRFIQNSITGLGSNPINLLDLRNVKKL